MDFHGISGLKQNRNWWVYFRDFEINYDVCLEANHIVYAPNWCNTKISVRLLERSVCKVISRYVLVQKLFFTADALKLLAFCLSFSLKTFWIIFILHMSLYLYFFVYANSFFIPDLCLLQKLQLFLKLRHEDFILQIL